MPAPAISAKGLRLCWAPKLPVCPPRRWFGSRRSGRTNTRRGANALSNGKEYGYVWADGVHFDFRLEEDRQFILALIGATSTGKKDLIAVSDGYRESEQSWTTHLLDCKARGLSVDPKLAIGDGALGFWKAVRRAWSTTVEQRCWVHMTVNVLDKVPKNLPPEAKSVLHGTWQADTKANATKAFDLFSDLPQGEISQADELPGQRQGCAARVLRFSGGALAAIPHDQPDRIDHRDGSAAFGKTKGCGRRSACLALVFQVDGVRIEDVANSEQHFPP